MDSTVHQEFALIQARKNKQTHIVILRETLRESCCCVKINLVAGKGAYTCALGWGILINDLS